MDIWKVSELITNLRTSAVKNTDTNLYCPECQAAIVCVAFASLSAVERGYQVQAIIDASGTWSDTAQTGAELAGMYSDLAIPFYGTLIALRS